MKAVYTSTRLIARQKPAAPAQVTTPLISAIILNFRRWDETAALIGQLLKPRHIHRNDLEVIVVDNEPDSNPWADTLKNERFRFIAMEKNVGFSTGINAGVKEAKGDWLLILNPDVILCQGFLDLLSGAARDVDEDWSNGKPVGIVGFQLHNQDGSKQGSTGRFPNLLRMVTGLFRSRKNRKYFHPTESQRQAVPWVTGSCLLIRKECFQSISGFDEDFFLYYEDVDLCKRAEEKGWAVCYEPNLSAQHVEPLQNRKLTEPMRCITRYASLIYFAKHLSKIQFWGLTRIIQFEARLRCWWNRWKKRTTAARMNELLIEVSQFHYCGNESQARNRFEHILQLAGL